MKKRLRSGELSIRSILATPPTCAQTQKVHDLLLALPGYGPVRVARLLDQCRISASKTVAGLSDRQRQELLGCLIGRAVDKPMQQSLADQPQETAVLPRP